MKLSAKIHTLIQFFQYIKLSKTKFKVHSPFVFHFILNILEKPEPLALKKNQELKQYYQRELKQLTASANGGAGSQVLGTKQVAVTKFIKKLGLPEKYGSILAHLSLLQDHSIIIELGGSLGISTSFLARNSRNKVYSIDINSEVQAHCKKAFEALDIKNVDWINASFDDVLEDLCRSEKNISLAFVDGNHQKDATLRYFDILLKHANENTVLVFDDIHWSKEMTEAWEQISQNINVTLSIDLFRIGIVYLNKNRKEKEEFILWY
ncbi:MAG: class I SAM-dependent methyltransferase [Chitinophagales bacterium]|nr:class I SAM-dependent methyltransferase [Chitinophagales bacterium]